MLAVVVFLCSVAVSHTDCNANTAIDVIRGPDTGSPVTCALMAQTLAARVAYPSSDDEYIVFRCTPKARMDN